MKIAIFGAGQLGRYIYENGFKDHDKSVYSHEDLDLMNVDKIGGLINKYDAFINCAGYTNVDEAENVSSIIDLLNANVFGPSNIAMQLIMKPNKKFIHISSAFVYGSNDPNYSPLTETSEKTPLNRYAKSKNDADALLMNLKSMTNNFLILCPAWLFGPNSDKNFITKIMNKMKETKELNVVTDERGSLTSVDLMMKVMEAFIDGKLPGNFYNVANEGYASRWDVAEFVRKELGYEDVVINKITSENFMRRAKIQMNSCLDCSLLKNALPDLEIPSWEDEVRRLMLSK